MKTTSWKDATEWFLFLMHISRYLWVKQIKPTTNKTVSKGKTTEQAQ